ncbi:MAG: transcription termination/antitermination protein NusA, partial [Patescibacteria group bacterium]
GIDPVGSCVGQRGVRVMAVINELGGENIDIISWSDDQAKFVGNALSPAKVLNVDLDEVRHLATVEVSDDQLSLAIGKRGQNVRLAAELTGWKIDVKGAGKISENEDVEKAEKSGDESMESEIKTEEIS